MLSKRLVQQMSLVGNKYRVLAYPDTKPMWRPIQYSPEEIIAFRKTLTGSKSVGVRDPFIHEVELEESSELGDHFDDIADPQPFGIRGSCEEIDHFFSTSYVDGGAARVVNGRRSNIDCFGTGIITLLRMRSCLGSLGDFCGVPLPNTTESDQVSDFLEKQKTVKMFMREIYPTWRSHWTRKQGKALLSAYLERVNWLIGVQEHIWTLGGGESFVFLLSVNPAEVDLDSSDDQAMGHWYIIQALRSAYNGQTWWTVHENCEATGHASSVAREEPSLFGVLSGFDICRRVPEKAYPSEYVQDYKDALSAEGLLPHKKSPKFYEMPTGLAVIWLWKTKCGQTSTI